MCKKNKNTCAYLGHLSCPQNYEHKNRKHKIFHEGAETHGRIIKWTQHIGFLTLAGMDTVIEGNHGNYLKEGQQEFCVYRF